MKLLQILPMTLCLMLTYNMNGQWPEATSTNRPWTRWWWHGSAVEKEEITRELESFSRIGLGGVEITPIYGVQGAEELENDFLSEDWLELVRHACLEAKRLGMQVDIVPGTGWRLGSEDVQESERAVILKLEIEEADGKKSYRATAELSGERVKRPAPGGSGFTLDMLNRDAVQHYLDDFYNRFFAVVPPDLVRGVFHDSWEYETDWTHDFEAEFKKRRGMDLAEILAVFDPDTPGNENDTIERWRWDYRQTLDELLLESFCDTWNAIAHENGLQSRNQAHGSIANLLDVYSRADIPETEIFRDQEHYLLHKFASSAAHVSGKNLVSSESYTWLSEHWTSDLAKIKKFTDYLFLCGINHIFFHGTAYSPEAEPWPGWVFYASTQLNDRNPLWNHLSVLNEYLTRCQSLLQMGQPYTEAYLYWPIADLYAEKAGTKIRQNIDGKSWFSGTQLEGTAQELWDAGVHFDYISDRQLEELSRSPTALPTVILPPLKRIPIETVEALDRLSRIGTRVLAMSPPELWKSPMTSEHDAIEIRLQKVLKEAVNEGRIQTIGGIGAIGLVSDSWQSGSALRCIRRNLDDGSELYFIANRSEKGASVEIPLPEGTGSCERMDPWTGKTGLVLLGDSGILNLSLEPYESTFLRVGEAQSATEWTDEPIESETRTLKGPWSLSFVRGGPERPDTLALDRLEWISHLGEPALESFAGLLRYEGNLILSEEDLQAGLTLDLGALNSSAQIFINGHLIGTSIQAPHRVDLQASHLVAGENCLVVEVATLASNRIRYMDQNEIPWRKFKDINFVSIDYKAFDASGWPLVHFGLKGPVRLVIGK